MATYYWRGLSNANWGTAGNWSTGSTSTLGGAVPTNVDDAIFDANSSACTINITTAVCRFVNFSAYTNTITFSNNLSIGVNGGSNAGVALGASMGISGTGALNLQTANATLTGNGRIWPNLLQLGTNVANSATAVSLLDTWIQYGNLNLSPIALRYNVSGTGRIDFYGSSLFTQGQFNVAGGSPKLVILSACTFEGTQPASGVLGIPIDFSAGTNVVTLGNLRITSGRWTYYSGIVTGATGTFVSVVGSVGNFDASGIIFNDLYIPQGTPASTHITTLFSDLNVRGDFYSNGGVRNIIISGDTSTNINLSGNCYLSGVTSGTFGTNGPTIRFKGPGTLAPPSESGGANFPSNISIENGANTLSIVGNIAYYQGGSLPRPTFTYTSGILDLSSHSYIIVQNGFLNLNGVTMKQVIFVQSLTTTLISRLSAETISFSVGSGGLTIDGSGGFTTGSLSYIQFVNQTVTLQNSVEYVINNSLLIRGTNVVNARLTSNSATLRTIFTLNPSATQDVGFVTTTRLDSSSGQTIYTRYGTLTNTLNWQLLRNPTTKATSFIL